MIRNKRNKLLGLNTQHITEPWTGAYQVRIVQNKKEYSRLFSWRPWGGKKKALQAANSWRDQIMLVHKIKPHRLSNPASNNLSTGILGICRTIQVDNRKDLSYVVYQVRWKDHTGKARNKGFHVGNVDTYERWMDDHARETAIKFRKEYEKHWDNGTLIKFKPENYRYWREGLW